MQYTGKLYGRLGIGQYFETGKTSEDWDNLERELSAKRLSYNIGYYSKALGQSGILSLHPLFANVSLLSELRTKRGIAALFSWAKDCHVIPSAITIFISIDHHSFTIKMINVREYRAKWEKKYKCKWDHATYEK